MPQLDKVTFFSQILVQAFFFSIVFIYLTTVVLPKLYYVKKTRQFCLDRLTDKASASTMLYQSFVGIAAFDLALSDSLKNFSESINNFDSLLEREDSLKTTTPDTQQTLTWSFVTLADLDLHSSFEVEELEELTEEDLDLPEILPQTTE